MRGFKITIFGMITVSLDLQKCSPDANSCLSIIFRGEYQGLQNNGQKQNNRFVCIQACMLSFNKGEATGA